MAAFPSDLLAGYQRYQTGTFEPNRRTHEDLAIYGQSPKVLIISCCDSRVTPEAIFNVGPGELFVIRNVANLVPPYENDGTYHGTSAALEYAVCSLQVEHIVVLGHAKCGGVDAFRTHANKPLDTGEFIGPWIKLLEPAAIAMACMPVDKLDDPQLAMEYAGVRQSLKNLQTFPFVQHLYQQGKLALHGGWFDIRTGELRVMDPETGEFHFQQGDAVDEV